MAEMKVSNTEDVPVAPGWVDQELDVIFAGLPEGHRAQYADCLAASRAGDVEAAHDRCQEQLLAQLDADGVEASVREGLRERLEALEAELTART